MPERVSITDVAPRDGLQNEPLTGGEPIPTERKAELIRALAAAHPDEIEVTSFVSPKWIPQLGDASRLCALLAGDAPNWPMRRSALVPNEQGMAALLEANEAAGAQVINKVSVFTAASETFSMQNTNATIAETIERFRPVIGLAREHGLMTRGYISCAFACPFEGVIGVEAVERVAVSLREIGVAEIVPSDTIGAAVSDSTREVIEGVISAIGAPGDASSPAISLHLHDTFGRAADCVCAALEMGIRSFDAAVGGLGGCPYASTETSRAPGNIDLHTLLATIEDAGYTHSVDTDAAAHAASVARSMRTSEVS